MILENSVLSASNLIFSASNVAFSCFACCRAVFNFPSLAICVSANNNNTLEVVAFSCYLRQFMLACFGLLELFR